MRFATFETFNLEVSRFKNFSFWFMIAKEFGCCFLGLGGVGGGGVGWMRNDMNISRIFFFDEGSQRGLNYFNKNVDLEVG